MTGVKRFEDLIAWQKARILTREIYFTPDKVHSPAISD
jgi:hypothetical protein